MGRVGRRLERAERAAQKGALGEVERIVAAVPDDTFMEIMDRPGNMPQDLNERLTWGLIYAAGGITGDPNDLPRAELDRRLEAATACVWDRRRRLAGRKRDRG